MNDAIMEGESSPESASSPRVTEEDKEERENDVEMEAKRAVCVERRDGPVTLRLLDAALWLAFKQEGTEMIITKAGRRMFPFVMVKVEGLCPSLLYSVHLSLIPRSHRQYKFCQRRWVKVSDTNTGSTPTPEQSFTHPASPNRGQFWCQDVISFAKLKITNNKHSQGDIVLQSMRKYMAQITVREDLGDTQYVFPLPETTFVAVTQYQNEAVTRMKIAHNPFANGFKSDKGKRLFSSADLSESQDFKRKNASSNNSKNPTKTARAKGTVNPKSLNPLLISTPLSSHEPEDLRLISPALPLPSCLLQPLPFSLALATEGEPGPGSCPSVGRILPGGFHLPGTASVTPYDFQSEIFSSSDHGVGELNALSLNSVHVEDCPETRRCFQDSFTKSPEEEDRAEVIPGSTSAITIPGKASPPTILADSEKNTTVSVTSASTVLKKDGQQNSLKCSAKVSPSAQVLAATPAGSAQSYPRTAPANLSKEGPGGPFKHPLPKRGAVYSGKGGEDGCSGSGDVADTEDDSSADFDRTSRRQYVQRPRSRSRSGDRSVKQDRGVQLRLHDGHTWTAFASCGSLMTISSEGSYMFPILSISLRGLDPGRLYSVWLHVTAADADVITAAHARGDPSSWGPLSCRSSRRPSLALPSVRPYMHPCSPMRGLAWMKVKVNFSEVKLSSTTLSLTSSDSNPITRDGLLLQSGRRYLTQVVVREEEEVTPNGAGGMGNIYFFPLPEVTFVTRLESSECVEDEAESLPVTTSLEYFLSESQKRWKDNPDTIMGIEAQDSDAVTPLPSKVPRVELGCGGGHWTRSPMVLPRHADLSSLLTRHPDLSPQSDLCGRFNPLYYFPSMTTLPSAHLGLLTNRMPLPMSSVLQPVASSFPFPAPLFPQLRTPMHPAFGMPVTSLNPFPYLYYPYSVPQDPVPPTCGGVADSSKVLDLSVKASAKST